MSSFKGTFHPILSPGKIRRYSNLSCQGKPMFKAENGAVIYFNKFLGGTGGTWNLKQPFF